MSDLEFWKDLGNIFDAVMDYQKKNVEFNSRFINPWIRLGNVFDRQDQANDAVQAYQRAIEIDPDSPQNWVELGDAQFKKGDHVEAIDSYRKAVTLDPEAGWPLGNLALSLVTMGKIEEAIPLYKKSIDLLTEVKDKAVCWNRLGNAYRKLNDYENAFHAFQKADQLDGENTGFSDTLDETPPSTSVIAPEEILEQMIEEQALEAAAPESTLPEIADAPVAEETIQPEVEMAVAEQVVEEVAAESTEPEVVDTPAVEEAVQPEVEPAAAEQVVEEAVAKSTIIEIMDAPTAEETVQPEAEVETMGVTQVETPEGLIALAPNMEMNVEANAIEDETVPALNEIGVEEPANEIPVAEEDSPLALHEKKFDLLQVVEAVIAKVERAYAEQKSSSAEAEVAPAESKSPVVIEEAAQEVEAITKVNEEVVPEVKIINEAAAEVEASLADDVNEEELALRNAEPRRAPAWLVIKDEPQPEPVEVKSVTTLSELPQEAAVSDLVVNMDIVETYTDPIAAQLTTEPNLSEEPTQGEAADPAEGQAEAEPQEMVAVDETSPVVETVVAEKSPVVEVVESQAAEMAYEEYLKDVVEPANALKDHVDDIQSEAPLTKISKNGEVRIAMDTKNAHVWNELGNIYFNAGNYDDAIASYNKAIELDRQFAWPYSNLALAYVQKGRFAEAVLLYQRGIELFNSDRDKAITWNRLGNVYRRINDYGNAINSYQTADELDPENATLSLRTSFGLLGNMYSDSKPALVA